MKGAATPLEARAFAAGGAVRQPRWRDRLLGHPGFQRWVARTPALRFLARRHAARLFRLCNGFMHSQLLYFSVRSGLLAALRAGPLTVPELQQRCRLDEARAQLLLQATEALDLTERRGAGTHGLGVLGAALAGNAAVLRMIEHQPLFYADLADPLALLQDRRCAGALAGFWAYAGQGAPEQAAPAAIDGYTSLMSDTQGLVAEDLLAAYPFGQHRCLLDVGGGNGQFLCAVAGRARQLRLMLFDLPAVAERGRLALKAAGLAGRSSVHGGNFSTTPLPQGADLISLVRVVHDHDDAVVLALLRAIRQALPRDGRVLIAEPMREIPGSLPEAELYMGFYLLALGQGRLRSRAELSALLLQAGFAPPRLHATARPWQCAVLSAAVAP
jgi:demethylspheroidene O-methyltransferase